MSAGLVKDATFTTVKQNLRNEIPVIDVTKSAPLKGSIAYNTSDNKLYFADGVSWIEVTDSNATGNTEFILASADPNYPSSKVLVGSANQINVLSGPGTVTLSAPQDIATTSNVVFGSVGFQGAPSTLSYYEEISLTLPMTGVSVPVNMDVQIVKIGKIVTLAWKQTVITADGTPPQISLPSRFAPVAPYGAEGAYISFDATAGLSQLSAAVVSGSLVSFLYGIISPVAGHTININPSALSWLV